MPHTAGIAATIGGLLTALQSACVVGGWTLSGDVLHKGATFVRVRAVVGELEILGGTGIDGANLLTGANGGNVCRLGQVGTAVFTFPVSYAVHVHGAPDEVYLFVQWSVDRYTWLAFGQSSVPGLGGSGGWYGASCSAQSITEIGIRAEGGTSSSAYSQPALFFRNSPGNAESYIHHGLDGGDWSGPALADCQGMQPLYQRQPNAWNSNAILLPLTVTLARPSSKVSVVADLAHCRNVRIDNYEPLQIVTVGPDRWRIYPWYNKNTVQRNGPSSSGQHTGTLGCAIRYDGP